MRTALLTFLALLVVSAPAQAASVKVTWPSDREVKPGDEVAVTVKAQRKVQVSVVRTNAAGKPIARVAKRSLKAGTLKAKLAAAGTYAVRVDDGARVRSRAVKAVAPPEPPAPVTPPAAKAPSPWDCAPATVKTVDVQFAITTIRPGEIKPYSIVNTSDGCWAVGLGYGLEAQQPDGTWQPVPWQQPVPSIAFLFSKGAVFTKVLSVAADAAPGKYRLFEEGAATWPEFEVVA
ncbi:hypothetical protein OJ997_02755 [Solirubrobacter phytolaccae]|uniref:BIG2 domain-containing protein n=1 Tax=Solirubrobacter phytolaccae TaxID=1404360 RepID=A0A9X3N3W1_9ACTN|nr:hypothetical protein [Solirubrobacter phytolaccae]MDA0179203.1 hypothetical protein [Solirubrobacter phytolaccae]